MYRFGPFGLLAYLLSSKTLTDPTTLLGLNIAQLSCSVSARVIEPITSVSQDDSCWHVLEAARAVKSQLQEMRQDGKFNELLIQVERQVMELDL